MKIGVSPEVECFLMLDKSYADFSWEQAAALLAIDSPSGFTDRAAKWAQAAFPPWAFPQA